MADIGPAHSPGRRTGATPGPRRLPVPDTEPPYDDERDKRPSRPRGPVHRSDPAVAPTQGALALSFTLTSGVSATPELRAPLRLVDEPAPAPARAANRLPDPRRWAARLTQAAVESLFGPRPVQQLIRWTDDAVYASLVRRVATRSVAVTGAAPVVRSVRLCHIADDVVEAGVVIHAGDRARAVAVRLEGRGDHWLCTALEVI
jgi:hypothetical protein